ncbi:MAG TPA: hypothetical protein VLL82_06185 [Mycobacterium sp.]|nr:hypothetical protein [Mycobacterium sp.]
MKPRNWVPDITVIAEQLISDYIDAIMSLGGPDAIATMPGADLIEVMAQADLDAIGTMESWRGTALAHGDEFTEDDWLELVRVLAKRAAWALAGHEE